MIPPSGHLTYPYVASPQSSCPRFYPLSPVSTDLLLLTHGQPSFSSSSLCFLLSSFSRLFLQASSHSLPRLPSSPVPSFSTTTSQKPLIYQFLLSEGSKFRNHIELLAILGFLSTFS